MPARAAIALLLALPLCLHAAATDLFETQVLPVLKQRCFECHAHATKIKGGLALDSRAGWETGGDHGVAVRPGEPDSSLLIKAVRYEDTDLQMPPKGRLSPAEIAVLEAWVKQGAPDPRAPVAAAKKRVIDVAAGKTFWAFQPVANPTPPEIKEKAWPLDPLDRFVLARQEAAGVAPVRDAPPHTWLRRAALDLTGLPPSLDDIALLEDGLRRHDAGIYAVLADRLLNSRAYGERWARHWLDLTGYADMIGTSNNVYAEHAWRYRDWLVAAFNADKPFGQFIREQLAGDLLPASSPEDRAAKLTATGFLMVGDVEIVNPDKAKMEADHVDTQVIKIGQAFLGMTLGCARCHDHKFDPIGLEDYYAIAGILRSSPSTHKMPDMGVWSTLNSAELPETPAQLTARRAQEAAAEQRMADIKAEQARLTAEKKQVEQQLEDAGKAGDKDALTKQRDALEAQLKKLAGELQHTEFFKDKTPRAYAMHDEKPGDMPVYIRGNPYATAAVVPRGALRVASWAAFPAIPAGQSGRVQLADWIADRRNPLAARVAVNRVWQKLFGTGLVSSVDYFGVRGDAPSNPALLDHLATRFMQGGGSQKTLLRALVLSRTYRLDSANDAAAMQRDPENKLLWRMNRQRLEAEALRDALLAVSGELTRGSSGPALVLENPANCGSLSLKGVNPPNYTHRVPRPAQAFERTLYLPVMRTSLGSDDKLRAFFDFVDPAMIAGQRTQSVMPTQSLFLLNSSQVRDRATALARLAVASADSDAQRLATLWLRVYARPITPPECEDALALLHDLPPLLNATATENLKPWEELCHALLASNEFVFRL